ncbi:MAG: diacylglycerol kinase family protein [Pseudomonadota bacterium]
MARNILVIANPVAGRGRHPLLDRTLRLLLQDGATITLRNTEYRDHVQTLVADASAFDRVVVAGGDGTINEALNGLVDVVDPPRLGFVPVGTSNVLAAELGIPTRAERLVETLLGDQEKQLSLGKVNGRYFAMMVGIGLDAHLVRGVDPKLKRSIGALAYVTSFFRQVRDFSFPTFEVDVDGSHRRVCSLVVSNISRYGPRWIIAPHADPSADDLQVCQLRSPSRWGRLATAVAQYGGRYLGSETLVIDSASERVIITGPENEPVQADGEVVATLPATIRVASRRVAVLSPDTPGTQES